MLQNKFIIFTFSVLLSIFLFVGACSRNETPGLNGRGSRGSENDRIGGKPNFLVPCGFEVLETAANGDRATLQLSISNPFPSPLDVSVEYSYSEGIELVRSDLSGAVSIQADGSILGLVEVRLPVGTPSWITALVSVPNPEKIPQTMGLTKVFGEEPAAAKGDTGKTVVTKDGETLSVILLEKDKEQQR